jgi:hypothetical protein
MILFSYLLKAFIFIPKKGKHLTDQRLGPFQVLENVVLKSYRLKLLLRCRLHLVFRRCLLSKASNSTTLSHQLVEIESDHNEYAIDYISDVKVDNRSNRRGLSLQFLTHLVGYDVPKWMLLEQVSDCEQLSVILSSNKWAQFSQTQAYVQFKTRHLARDVDLYKRHITDLSLKGEVFPGEGCSITAIVTPNASLVRTE